MNAITALDDGFGRFQAPLDAQALQALRVVEETRAAAATEGARSAEDGAEAAKRLESYFAMMLVREMRRSMPEGFFSGSGSDVYGAWFDEHLGAAIADRDALGMAGMIKAALGREALIEEQGAEDEPQLIEVQPGPEGS